MTIEALDETFEVYDIDNQRSWFITKAGVELPDTVAQDVLDNCPDLAQKKIV